jgi:uncharacterized repeat protein (TIGR01451 family)
MKRSSILGLGAIALVATVPFVCQIPVVANLFQPGSAIAQNIQAQPQIQLRLSAEKQVLQQDKQEKPKVIWEALQGKTVVQPGNVLRYTISGENKSDRLVKNLTINQPIPQGMVYVLKSAGADDKSGAKITYSIDGGRNYVENPTVKVTLPDGKVEIKPAPATAYTNLRVNIPSIEAKAVVKANYQVQVR